MIQLDGSFGEGGGQIVRTAVGLSVLTAEPVRIFNIRAGRPKPGLSAQHKKAIELAALISGSETEGVKIGSSEIVFRPGSVRGGSYTADIGTAGSITLLLQCVMIAIVRTKEPVKLKITGGTDVEWSPTIDYLRYVTLPVLKSMGYECSLYVHARGYYPRGGGSVSLDVEPSTLKKLVLNENEKMTLERKVCGISHSSKLPEHVARRQAESADRHLRSEGYESRIAIELGTGESTGSGITLWCGHKGASCTGKRGVPAEAVGKEAAEQLIRELRSKAAVDVHLADQLIPYMGLAGGSMTVREVSMHTKTNIWVTEHFFDVKFNIDKTDEIYTISCLLPQ